MKEWPSEEDRKGGHDGTKEGTGALEHWSRQRHQRGGDEVREAAAGEVWRAVTWVTLMIGEGAESLRRWQEYIKKPLTTLAVLTCPVNYSYVRLAALT